MGPHDFRYRHGTEDPDETPLDDGDAINTEAGEADEGDLELPDTASLTGISIRRHRHGMAKPAVQPTRPAEGIVRSERTAPRNLPEYWDRLRKGRRWPQRGDVDPKQIALHWPNTLLMRVGVGGDPWRFESLISGIMRGGGHSFHNGDVEFNSMVMEWILEIGRKTERGGAPVEEIDSFPTAQGQVRYRALAVPLGDNQSLVNYILCHVARV